MIIQGIDLGYNPARAKWPYQHEIGDVLVEGGGHVLWARGGKPAQLPVTGWIKVDPTQYPLYSDGFEGLAGSQTLWRSIGTDSKGTLASWTTDAGSPTIASNLATVPALAALRGGHADWRDCTALMRFVFSTNAQPSLEVHANGSGGTLSLVRARVDGTNLHLDKVVSGTTTNDVVAAQAAALTNGTAYWLQVQASGTTYTVSVYNDSAGAQGGLIRSFSGTVSDAAAQVGRVRVENPGSASFNFGGAFSGVFVVSGPAPSGWSTSFVGGSTSEAAFAWSKQQVLAGTYAASIFSATTADAGLWQSPTLPALLAQTIYRITGQAFIVSGGTLTATMELTGGQVQASTVAQNAWTQLLSDFSQATALTTTMDFRASGGTGTAYFDQVALLSQQLANELVAHQLEELARNREQQPVDIVWSSLRSLPQDGWFWLEAFTPDYTTTMGGAISFTATLNAQAPQSAPPQLWWAGGQRVGTSFSATPMNLVSAPPGSQGIFPLTRASADGNLPTYVAAAPANPLPVQWSATPSDRFRGRVRVYDAGGPVSQAQYQVPTDGRFTNPNWTEARSAKDRYYLGDMVVTNGLLLVVYPASGSVSTFYLWNTQLATAAWQQIGSVAYNDTGGAPGTLRALQALRVGTEEFQGRATSVTVANAADVLHKLQRGRYDLALALKGRTQAAAAATALQLLTAFNGQGFVYNSVAGYDQLQNVASSFTSSQRASDYPFAALVFPNASYPFICGVLYNQQPTRMPDIPAAGGLNFGDTVNPSATGLSADFGVFAVPFAAPQNLQAFMSAGTLSGGFTSATDSGSLGAHAAKLPSGTAAGAIAMAPLVTLPAGSYLVFVRLRVTSAASGATQLRIGLYDGTSGWVAGQYADFAPSAFATSYAWYRAFATPATINAAHQQRLRVEGVTNAAATDFWVDEMWVVPMGIAADLSGPADIAQQFLFDRTVRFPVV